MANNNETTIENPFNTGDASKKKEKSPQPQPNYADLVAVDNVQPNYADLVKVDKGVGGHLKDFGASLASGAASLPDIAIGIGDLYSGGRAGKAIEDSGIYTPGSGSDYWRDKKTINSKAQDQQFAAAEGIVDKAKVALTNPTMISNAVGESLAPMAAGGLVGRGINVASKGKIGAAAAGAIGEGVVMGGSQAESIRQQTDDGLLTGGQVGAAMATGVAGSAFGYLGGRIAQKLGFDDIDNMMANGVRADAVQEAAKDISVWSIPAKILAGAVSEGVLEELPQSAAEQALQNLALGKPWNENIDDAIVMGTLAGMAMGGGINAYTSSKEYLAQKRKEKPQENTNPDVPMLPLASSALEGEFIPGDRGQPTTDAQGRTTYEYDQFSTDADNLLDQGNGFNPMQGNFPENPDSPIAPTTPPLSRQLGINPEDGPLSGAAALAVDSGATASMLNAPNDATKNDVESNPNNPLSNAVPSNYQSLLGNSNEQFTPPNNTQQGPAENKATDTATTSIGSNPNGSIESSGIGSTESGVQPDGSSNHKNLNQIGTSEIGSGHAGGLGQASSIGREANANSGNDAEVQAGQNLRDLNAIGDKPTVSEAQPSQSNRVQPILGADGKNKWFGSQDKADAFIEKKNLGNDYQVIQDGKRFEIQPKAQSQDSGIQTSEGKSKLAELEHQLTTEKSVPKKAQIRNQIAELQNGLNDQVQSEANLSTPQKVTVEKHRENFAKMDRGVARINAVRQRMRAENPEIFTEANDRVRETHGLTNARVTAIADEIESSGSYELSDREYEKVKNNQNYKIDYNPKTFTGKVTAVKDQHSGEWVGLSEQDKLVTPPTLPNLTGVAKVAELEQQLAVEKSVIKKVRLRKQIAELQKDNPIDQAAHAAATSIQNDLPEPTQAQIEAGNYKKGHIKVHGLDIAVENPRGSERRGTDPDGNEWAHTMSDHYGYIKRTVGADQENIDTYVGQNHDSDKVYVVDQIDQGTGGFDEHKVMLGFDSQEEAVAAYQSNFDKGWKVGAVNEMTRDQFKDWLKNSDTSKAVSEQSSKAEQPKVEAKKGDSNKIFTKDAADAARELLRKKLGQLNAGIDPEILQAGLTLAGYHIESGARSFATYSKAMLEDMGDMVKPYLKSWYMGIKYDPRASDFDGMSSAAEVEAFNVDATLTDEGTIQGKTETVITPSGREFEVQHKLIEIDQLITSNTDSGAVNRKFPQELQPRDRTTLKSVTQINDIANKLQPKLLGESASSTNGAPIVSAQNEVESGNGRTIAIRRAYDLGKAENYKDWLKEQGHDIANMDKPILVRERITPMSMADRIAYTTESNERDTLDLSPSEQAMSDAPKVMQILHLVQGGNLNNMVNRPFVNAFLTGVASKNERGTMLDKDGVSLTQDGYRRIEAALLAAAFNDDQIINSVIESKDSDIKAIGNALLEVAPRWAEIKKGVQDGILVDGVDVSANLVEAVHLVQKARQQNLALFEMLNQDDIFEGGIDQITKDFISILYSGDKLNKARSKDKVVEALNAYAQLAVTAKASPNLFGDAPLSNQQILGTVNDKLKQSEAEKQQDFFSSQGTNDTNAGKFSQVGQGSKTSEPDARTPQSNTAVKRAPVNRPKNDTTLVQDWGVQYVDGHAKNDQYPGKIETDYGVKDGVKAAFLKDSKQYLEAVQKNLESIGYELHNNKKGKPEKVSINESGVAGSGEVSLYIREPITGTNVYMSIGDGYPGSHPQRIGILYRATMKESDKQASGFGIENSGNAYAGAQTSAFEMAQMIDDMVTALVKRNQNKGNGNEQSTSNSSDPKGTPAVRSGGSTTQQGNSQTNPSNVETGVPTGSTTTGTAQDSKRPSIRDTGKNVANNGAAGTVGNESNRRKGTSGAATLPIEQPTKLESNAALTSTAKDFHMTDPDLIFGGGQKQRFDKNKAAIELLDELTTEGRQATPEEQIVLASYTGWGSFGQDLFQGTWNTPIFKDGWKDQNTWLRENLGKESWESAKDSILNAFFTDPYTVQAMWSMAEKMGFTGGRVLEPAVGTGNFISLMPQSIKARSQVTAIDLDITTASISKQLFPESNVQNIPYQKSKTPDNFYDLVITNVPFSNDVKIADRRYNQFNPNLHDYFFLKALDQVRPGGIVMAITSSGTMDKQSEVIRRELAKQAELITSIRLPSGAFKAFAGTAVVTDIIVLRKRAAPLAMTPDANWIGLSEVKTSSKPVKVNSFYAENLRNVLGTIDYKSGDPRFAGMTVQSNGETWLKNELNHLADLVPENGLLPRHSDDHLTYYANKAGERTNTLTMSNGEMMFVYGDQMVKAADIVEYKIKDEKKTAQRQKSIEGLIEIRKAYTDLTDAERTEQDNVEQLRKTLNKLYQSYVKEHGALADSFGLQYFKKVQDAYYYSLAALETKGKPAEILKRSVVRGNTSLKNPTVSDAFVVERNKNAAPSLANIAKLANVSEDQARAELIEKGAVYVLPNSDIMPSDMYLSGNVRLKLEEAQQAVLDGDAELQRNIDALKQIIPDDIPYFNIEAKMGATWVPLSDYEKYIAHMLGMTDTNGITVTFPSGKWKVNLENNASRRTEAATNYGSKYKSFQTVVSAALSNQNLSVKYKNTDGSESVDVAATEELNEKVSKIKEDFAAWLWSDPERRIQLEKEYNHTFNAWATPKYDGSFMSMQGMALSLGNGPFGLRQHQQNAIWRAIVNRRSINAHEVGTGKTFTMGGIALESRRYGIAKKPLILAHNANSAAVAKEIQMMYPAARILFISEMGKAVRQIRMRQIANDDWDVVVMPHSMIDKLTLSEETLMAMAADDIAALETELEEALLDEGGATLDEVLAMDSETVNKKMGFKNPTAKQLAKQRLKLLEDIQKQAMDSSKADAVNFEELGVDMIMVDEVHEFKKPSIATRMNMKGLNTSSNKRSVNLQLLTRYVRRMNNGGNVHTFTGTPITNTLTEIYHQMRYVMEEEMQKLNVSAWDGWFGSFATDITDIELSATGEYQLVTRLAGFVNVPELRKLVGQFMDIVFANDMPEMQPRKTKSGKILSDDGLTEAEKAELLNGRTEGAKDRPYKKVINITTEMSPMQEQALQQIQALAKEWERATGKEKRKWMRDGDPRAPLSISTAAKKASYDARIGDPEYVGQEGLTIDFEMSKASQVVKNVMEVYKSHPLASQVIFADSGYNTSTERSTGTKDTNGKTIRERVKVFSPIKDIVERLVQQGIPREQIAIVNGDVKAEARKAIADKVNTGEIRVVIGLTQTLGVGVNMQKNLRAMHQLDAPWMPGELEQRNGRGLRQANQWNTVLEYRYITDKLDGKSWQVLAIKDRFINAFMKADGSVRSIEGDAAADNGEDNAGDIMSSFSEASGDPRVMQRIKTKEKLEKLQRKERLHTQGIADMRRTIGNTQRRIARIDEQLAEYSDNKILDKIQDLLKAQSENFTVHVDGQKIEKHKEASEAINQFIADNVRVGSQPITLGKYASSKLTVEWDSHQPQATLSLKVGPIQYDANTLRGLEGQLRGAPQEVRKLEQAKAGAQDTINSLSKAAEQPFGQAEQLTRTQKQLEFIEKDLEQNPVAPPIWLRRGTPVDSEVYYKGKLFVVSGHRYTNDGWFVSAEDAKGSIEIPYMEATDSVGMPVYEERTFEAPNIEDKTKVESDLKDYSRKNLKPDEERKGTSPISTSFEPLSVVSASRRVLSVLQHIKLPTTQDTSISGRITVGSVGNKGGFSVHIISSFDGLPSEIQNDATYQDEDGKTQNYDVSGVWHDGTLYVVADQVYGDSTKQLTTFDAYEELLAHEIIGHFGVQQIFGSEYKTKLQQLFNALGGINGIRKIAKNNGVDMQQFESAYIQPYTQGAIDKIYTESDVQQALVGELFAFVAQNQSKQPFVRQKLKEVIGFIRQWFRERGFDKFLSRYNDTDLMMFIAEARKATVDQSYFGKYKDQRIANKKNEPLYSRQSKSNSSSTIQQVRDVLVKRFGEDVISELEQQGKLEIIQDYDVEGVEGFYYNGKAVLVASNLTAESTVPTFLHELGGHGGFQNMMSEKQYQELMRQFDKLVEQGNPVAMAAKLLAEREQGTTRQKLEYLPYLLTLSSTMQQRNVIQRNALQKLINNIVAYVKAWAFDRLGLNLNLNPDDMLALSERMVDQIRKVSSLDLIRQKYQGTSQWMTAPNGANTHLSEQQWLQVRTPEFKKWFGDWENDTANASQVLDENGEPKVVYHGTATEFNEFKQGHGLLGDGIYLTDRFDTADMYANIRGNNGFVLPLFVNIRSAFKTSGNVSRDKVVEATRSGKYQGVVHQFDNQEYIVALESNQVKMAEGNTGTFNSESADIRFSRRSDQIKDMLNTIVSNMNKQGVKKVKQQASFKFDHALGYLLQGLGRRQLTEVYAKLLPQLEKYNNLAAQMDADKNEAGARADEIVVKWAKVKDEQQLAELMHEATLAKIDPDKPYVSGDSVSKYKQLRNDFRSLSPEAQSMYRQARDEYKKHHRDVLTAIKERIMRASIGNTKKAELMKQMDDNFFHGLKGVYFPLSRFGQYVILVRDKNGVVESVNRAETRSEAEALHADLVKMFPNSKVEKVIRDKAFNASRDMVGRGFMTDLFDELDKFGLSATKQAELEDILGQLYLSSLPDLSWAKHGIHRKGTAGFSQDARRAFAQNMFHGASYLAKLRYADVMVEQLDEMQKYADQRKNDNLYDQPVAQAVIDEMNSRHESLMSPDSNPLSSALTSLGFIYFLGLSVASGAVNLLQTVLVAYPQMGAKWGFDKAFAELNKAGLQSIKGGNDISKSLQGDELKAYNEAVRRGVIDVTQAHDLAGIAQGEDSGVMWKLRPIMRWASFIFHQAERFNREVTFVASYRLAKSTGVSHNIAFEQAMKATYDGHFDYSSGNRPRVMQGNVAKVILLFKQFGQNMIYTMLRSLHQTFKAETPAARKEAFRALTGIMGAHAVFAGTLGLPLISTLLGLISFFGGSDDEPWDAETALKNNLSDVLGVTVTDVLMNGVSRVTPWDISGRVSINNLIVPKTREGLEGESKAQAYMSAAIGPIGGIFINILKGFSEIADGHGMRGVETMSPTFLRGPLRAIRFADEGAQDKTGVSIQDDVGIAAILGQAAGFAPSDVRLATEGRSAVYDLQKKLDNRRSSLMTKFARAKLDDDQETMNEAWGEIEKFNQANPSRRINRIQAMQSYKKRKKRIDNAEHGMVVTRKKREDLDQGRFAYND